MINDLVTQVEGVFGLSAATPRRKRQTSTARAYRAPARRTVAKKRKAKRMTNGRRR